MIRGNESTIYFKCLNVAHIGLVSFRFKECSSLIGSPSQIFLNEVNGFQNNFKNLYELRTFCFSK